MKTSNLKKALLTGVSLALVAVMAVAGTVAYLQGSTDDVVNTFSTNKVDVGLAETTGNDYNIIPGTSQEKDPTVKVDNSVDAYVYVTIQDDTDGLVTYEIAEGWTALEGYDNVYYREVKADDDVKEFSVLKDDKVSYSASLTNADMLDEDGKLKTDIKLTFQACAIQQEGFDTPEAGWLQIPTPVSSGEDLNTALTNGGNIVLDENMTAQEWTDENGTYTFINVDSPSNIDLNGHTLTADWININADVTIENGDLTVDNADTFFAETADTTVTLKNVTLTTPEGSENDGIILSGYYDGVTYILDDVTTEKNISANSAAIVVNSGTYSGDISGAREINGGTFNGDILLVTATEINDGEITGTISTSGNSWALEINDGEFAKNSLIDTVNGGTGRITINGGTFQCTQILGENKSFGHLYITGGTFTEKLTINTTYASVINISDGKFEGLDLTGNAYSPITISGGTFGSFSAENGTLQKLTITGGTFGSDPSAYVGDDYEAVGNNGTWTVVAKAGENG